MSSVLSKQSNQNKTNILTPEWFLQKKAHFLALYKKNVDIVQKYGLGIVSKFPLKEYINIPKNELKIKENGKNVQIYSLEEAQKIEELEKCLKKFSLSSAKEIENNPVFSYIAAEGKSAHLVNVEAKDKKIIDLQFLGENVCGYVMIFIAPNTNVTIVENIKIKNSFGIILDVIVSENAQVNYVCNSQKNNCTQAILRNAILRKDASIKWIDIQKDCLASLSHIHTYLSKPGSNGEVYGVFLGKENEKYDIYHTVNHIASNTSSNMKTNGVLDNSSEAIYRGNINIKNNASNCKGYQKEKTLLLSNNAKIASVPNLEIANSEVQCSHGVTTTAIKEEDLFYMQSRGININTAMKLAKAAHILPILENIDDEEVKELVTKNLNL